MFLNTGQAIENVVCVLSIIKLYYIQKSEVLRPTSIFLKYCSASLPLIVKTEHSQNFPQQNNPGAHTFSAREHLLSLIQELYQKQILPQVFPPPSFFPLFFFFSFCLPNSHSAVFLKGLFPIFPSTSSLFSEVVSSSKVLNIHSQSKQNSK